MKQKILSISRQSFRKLREDNCIYVDKTELIYDLCSQGRMYFLSRPRRFGKSLLLSTMHELFLGSQELFKETWIADKWDWSKKSPVIHFSFDKMPYKGLGLDIAIIQEIKQAAEHARMRAAARQWSVSNHAYGVPRRRW